MDKIFRNFKIRNRLVLLFTVLSLLPLLVIVTLVYKNSSDAMKTKISTYSVEVMRQVSENIERELDKLQNDSVEIEFSDAVQNILLHCNQMSEWEIEDAKYKMRENHVKKFSFLHDVSDVLIYTMNRKKVNAYGNSGFSFNFKQDYLEDYLDQLYSKGGAILWTPVNIENEYHPVANDELLGKKNGILLGRAVKSLEQGDIIGYLMIRANERQLSNIYKNIDIGQDADIFVLDKSGIVVSSRSSSVPVTSYYSDENLIKHIKDNYAAENYTFPYEFAGGEFLVSFAPVKGVEWFVVGIIPFSYLNSDSEKMVVDAIFIGIGCFIISILLAYVFSANLLAPIEKLQVAMNRAQQGDLSVSITDHYHDEIGEVTRNFNYMLSEIKNLMENAKNKENQKRLAELKALQAQINPHFLSNTLNTVKFLAKAQKAENIENITTSLIQLFHMTMGKGEDLITIGEEIEYIKNYINIQEYRYLNKFKINYDIEPKILECKIPRLLLQPVVENALIHGVGPMDGQGMIVIKGFCYDGAIKMIVTDNGVGIVPGKLEALLNGGTKNSHMRLNGLGIANVDERIKLYFGIQYGLSIESVPGLYTTVEIALPVIKQGSEK
ncbi:MAG: integral rane sensor signal transduction histidine kinase [Firmicutes bacterium]|nr:integral rane sensor signal transduction histidine kinase [Bacillota bacterium]